MSQDALQVQLELKAIRREIAKLGLKLTPTTMTFGEAARALGRSPSHITRLVKRGVLRPVVAAGERCIPAHQIVALKQG